MNSICQFRSISGTALLLGALLGATTAFSASNSAGFVVKVRLQQPGVQVEAGTTASAAVPASSVVNSCFSQSLSTGVGAQVSVLCGSSQVVQIDANTSGMYVPGVHGGAFQNLIPNQANATEPGGELGAPARAGWRQAIVSPALVSPMSLPQSGPSLSESRTVEFVVTF